MYKRGDSSSTPVNLVTKTPVQSPAFDPRLLALIEWEAVQHLCEALVEAGSARGRSLLPLARRPVGEILL